MTSFLDIKKELRFYADKDGISNYQRFFKTGRGEYGEGDKFLGVIVPNIHIVAKKFSNASFDDLEKLLKSPYHEERMVALFILVRQFEKAGGESRRKIFNFYLKNRKGINNWDLVDSSAYKIVGAYLADKPKDILYKLAKSQPEAGSPWAKKNLWDRRIAIVSTFHFIKENSFDDTIAISEILLNDKHDLIHKAVGWMLREVGKRDVKILEKFLEKHSKNMPRTMLRYSIEKFPEAQRKGYLNS